MIHARAAATSALLLGGWPLHAQTLEDAFARVTTGNPEIGAARASLLAADAAVDVARAQRRFQLTIDSGYETYPVRATRFQSRGASLYGGAVAELPIWTGHRAGSALAIARAERSVRAAELDELVNMRLADTATTTADVLRDRALLALGRQRVDNLRDDVTATRRRRDAHDLSGTDVAQAEARLAVAMGGLANAEKAAMTSAERYRALVGDAPSTAIVMPALPAVPLLAGWEQALPKTPTLTAASARMTAAAAQVRLAQSQRLPTLTLVSQLQYRVNRSDPLLQGGGFHGTTLAFGMTLRMPLYQGGSAGAAVRQAQADQAATIEDRTRAERDLIAEIRSRHAALAAADAIVDQARVAVRANRQALRGVILGERIGDRDLLDVLNAEQELFDAEALVARAERDRVAQAYVLLALMGRLGSDVGTEARRTAMIRVPVTDTAAMPGVLQLAGASGWSLAPGRGVRQA